MFYRQFSKIIDVLDAQFVKEFDFWLTTLPDNEARSITVSAVASRFVVNYSVAEAILQFANKEKILEKCYVVKCDNDDCKFYYGVYNSDELLKILNKSVYCHWCDSEFTITENNVYIAYKRVKRPEVADQVIKDEIFKRLGFSQTNERSDNENFRHADLLGQNIEELYNIFYHPDESAYNEFKELRRKLDLDYGRNMTAKGKALEKLVLKIFNQIVGVRCTNDIKTGTNQFDCTGLCGISTVYLSVLSMLSPYFIIECKNEPEKKPNNNYCNKLLSIMETNAAQVGIVFGRKDATGTCFGIAREHYLKHMDSQKQQIIITCYDKDLEYLIDKRVNLLKYLEYKFFQITANSPHSTYEMFIETDTH